MALSMQWGKQKHRTTKNVDFPEARPRSLATSRYTAAKVCDSTVWETLANMCRLGNFVSHPGTATRDRFHNRNKPNTHKTNQITVVSRAGDGGPRCAPQDGFLRL